MYSLIWCFVSSLYPGIFIYTYEKNDLFLIAEATWCILGHVYVNVWTYLKRVSPYLILETVLVFSAVKGRVKMFKVGRT